MISDFLSAIIVCLMVVLVAYPAFHLARQTWAARQRRPGQADQAPKRRF